MAWSRPDVVDVVTGLAALSCPAVLFVVVGPLGAIAGGAAVLVWFVAPVYGFAVGQFGLVAAVPELAVSSRFLVAQEALFVLLVLGLIRRRQSAVGVLAFVLTAAVLAAGVLYGVLWDVDPLGLAAALVGVVALAGYGLHRYERVQLGLAGPDTGERS